MFTTARSLMRLVIGAACAIVPAGAALAQIDIVTERYDDARLGANLQETQLNPSTVNVNNFGKVWSYTVSGSVYAQPLYVRNVSIPGKGIFNVLYVVTMNDIVYAFDADSSNDSPLLQVDLTTEVSGGAEPIPVVDIIGFVDNIQGNVGIESTPVIDLSTNTMYLVARTEEPIDSGCSFSTCIQRLHALDITTLEERPGSPVVIGGTVPCNNVQSDCHSGVLTFDPVLGDQRASLALTNGRVFIAWSAHSDVGLYHGYVMAYDAATLQQTMIWSSAPDASSNFGAGIWMGGRAPAVDADGNVYYMTGNGTWDGTSNFGESFVKFGPTPDSPFIDWMTPADDYQLLNNFDLDLSGSGPILIPGTDLILGGGKSGYFYLQDSTDLQHLAPPANIVQIWENSRFHDDYEQIKGGPVYWNRDSGLGPWMYVWSDGCNNFNAYHFNITNGNFDLPPVSQSSILSPCGSSGGVLTLSADGSTAGSGIVWSSMPQPGEDGNSHIHPGMLRAFDADDLTNEIWNSTMNDARDDSGNWPKFSPPTVVNGRVYLGSFPDDGEGSTQVNVYGLLDVNPEDFSLSATPPNPGAQPGGSVTYTIDTGAINGFSSTIHLDVSGLPNGADATFSANDFTPPAQPTLTVDLASLTAPGQYTLTITGTGGSREHSVDVGLYVTNAAPGAGIVSVDFVGDGEALAATDAAGVPSKPNWNDATDASGTQLALLDESGVDTGARLDWTADATGALGIAADSADFVMMNGYVDANTSVSLTVTNLPVDPNGYTVYVYADGDNGAVDQTGTYAFLGNDGYAMTLSIVDAADTDFDGTFVRAINGAGNYALFFTDGNGFTLTATPGAGGGPVPINGIQIVHGNPDRVFANGFDP